MNGCIHRAIDQDAAIWMVRLLIQLGADIEEVDSEGRMPLQHAAIKLQEDICEFLLDRGANIASCSGDRQFYIMRHFKSRKS